MENFKNNHGLKRKNPNEASAQSVADLAPKGCVPQNASLTIITSTKPKHLSKCFYLDDKCLKKLSGGGKLVSGNVETRQVSNLADLANILVGLSSAQALIYGIPKDDTAHKIVMRRNYGASAKAKGVITRTDDAFMWPDGPGVIMLDYDPPSDDEALSRDELVKTIRHAVPSLANAAMLWCPSASSCIWHGDKELRGVKGQRLYIIVTDAADIPRAGRVLVDRLWLAGHGHVQISSSGQMLERTLVDASVWQTSHLDFAGGAVCMSGLEQRRGDPILIDGDAKIVDSCQAFPDLSAEEAEILSSEKQRAKDSKKSEAATVRKEWEAKRVREMVPLKDRSDPAAIKAAKAVARRALVDGVLDGKFRVHVNFKGEMQKISVSRLLKNRDRYHGCQTRDPIEPGYDGGRLVGKLYLMQGRPSLHSFAHGGKSYRLSRNREAMEVVAGHTSETVATTIDLLRNDPIAFDFGGQLVVGEEGQLHPLCENGLANHLGNSIQFFKMSGKDEPKPIDVDPPSKVVKQIIALGDRRKLKPLDAVITGPTIRLDGTPLTTPGYDEDVRLLFDPLGEDVPDIPEKPTLEEATEALGTLMDPFREFPFVDAAARGALLAALLTAAVRPVLPTAPAFAFDAPVQGSGKTLLASCVGALVEGQSPDVYPHTQGRDDEEVRKRLFAALRTGCRALVWDNVTGVMDSASMAAFITSSALVDRVLGKSESIRVPNRALLILTGNNLSFTGDLPRRVITCRIDPQMDEPFTRQFDFDPLAHVICNRVDLLAAACILIRGRFTHLKDTAPGELASFEDWDRLVRQTVVWADRDLRPGAFGDPMDLVKEAQAGDPEADALGVALVALHTQFGDEEFSARMVSEAMNSDFAEPLRTALADLVGEHVLGSARSIGKVIKFRDGRRAGGMRLASRQDTKTNARVYRVEKLDDAP